MEKQEQKHEQEPERKEEQEQVHKGEQKQVHKEEQGQSNEYDQHHTNPIPDPPSKLNSPPLEPELRQANPSSPPKKFSPPRLPYHNFTPKSLPLGEDEEEEEEEENRKPSSKLPLPPAVATAAVETKVEPPSREVQDEENGLGVGVDGRGRGDGFVNTGRKFLRNKLSISKKEKRDNMMNRALIVSRISGFVFSLVSFSVMAADKDRGWTTDSFYHYKEFRYCLAVNVIACMYSGFQAYYLICKLTSGKHKEKQPVRHYMDFSLDQVITYLLISASSSAAVRVDDWQSNWGKDPFPDMARASVALSFVAFVALALSSLISGYKVYTLKSL